MCASRHLSNKHKHGGILSVEGAVLQTLVIEGVSSQSCNRFRLEWNAGMLAPFLPLDILSTFLDGQVQLSKWRDEDLRIHLGSHESR